MTEKQKVILLIDECTGMNSDVIRNRIEKKLSNYAFEDYLTLPRFDKLYIHYLYDVLFFIKKSSNISEFYSWVDAWKNSEAPCRYKITGIYNL